MALRERLYRPSGELHALSVRSVETHASTEWGSASGCRTRRTTRAPRSSIPPYHRRLRHAVTASITLALALCSSSAPAKSLFVATTGDDGVTYGDLTLAYDTSDGDPEPGAL